MKQEIEEVTQQNSYLVEVNTSLCREMEELRNRVPPKQSLPHQLESSDELRADIQSVHCQKSHRGQTEPDVAHTRKIVTSCPSPEDELRR